MTSDYQLSRKSSFACTRFGGVRRFCKIIVPDLSKHHRLLNPSAIHAARLGAGCQARNGKPEMGRNKSSQGLCLKESQAVGRWCVIKPSALARLSSLIAAWTSRFRIPFAIPVPRGQRSMMASCAQFTVQVTSLCGLLSLFHRARQILFCIGSITCLRIPAWAWPSANIRSVRRLWRLEGH